MWTVGDGLFEGCTSLESAEFSFGADGGWQNISSIFKGCTSLKSVALQGNLMGDIPHYMFEGCSSLTDIIFKNATKSSWKNTAKGAKWDRGTPDYVIHCSDGDILKSDPESGSDDTPDAPIVPDVPKVVEKDVNFYDYDGTLLHSYTIAEAQALTELPPLPTQEGLVCQGWNFDLETIKSHNRALDIGATYITDDGKTRLYIKIESEARMDVPLLLEQSAANCVIIDWGDGSATQTIDGTGKVNTTHTYASIGDYVISLDVADGCTVRLGQGQNQTLMGNPYAYRKMVKRIEGGKNLKYFSGYELEYFLSLEHITLPEGFSTIGTNTLRGCCSLKSLVLPKGCGTVSSNACAECTSLRKVILSETVSWIYDSAFYNCASLQNITLPDGISYFATKVFDGCRSLNGCIEIPKGLTKMTNNMFYNCAALDSVALHDGITEISSSALNYCESLTKLVVPPKVTNIQLYHCGSLSEIILPDGITAIMMRNCSSLKNIKIPKSVTNIAAQAFYECNIMEYYDFTDHESVPTLANTNAFYRIPSDCEIRVPMALVDEWKAATNWSTYADQIVGV